MQVQKISSPSFGALIKIEKMQNFAKQFDEAYKNLPDNSKLVLGTSSTSTISGASTAIPLANTAGTASNIAGSAFILDGLGANSFGIVPYTLDKIAITATPATVHSSAENPSITGSIFSTMGNLIHQHFRLFAKTTTQKNIPS